MTADQHGAPVTAPRRLVWIDALRCLAAFGIVWYHSAHEPGRYVAYAGLIVFVVLTAFFEAGRTHPADTMRTVKRYLLPWAVWFLLYAAINILQHEPATRVPGVAGILYGSSPHLWYLPLMLAVALAIRGAGPLLTIPAVIGMFAALVFSDTWRPALETVTPPLPQYAHVVVPICFGIVLARSGFLWRIVLAIALALMLVAIPIKGVGLPYLLGCAAVILAQALDIRGVAAPKSIHAMVYWVTPLMFGVYLSHPLFLAALRRIGTTGPLLIAFAFALSLLATAILRTTKPGRLIT